MENLTLVDDTEALVGIGNSLNNMIKGNENANLLEGHAGNDTLDGGLGADIMQGGLDNDTYLIDDQHDQVIEELNSGIDLVYSGLSTYTLTANVENLTLTGFENNSGIGNNLDNIILGNQGDNQLKGLQGNDTLDGGLGADTMIGGLGDDIYYIDNILDQVVEETSAGIDTIYSNITFTASANVENIVLVGRNAINATGNVLNNTLTGNDANNILFGGKGQDTLIGGLGNDVYFYTSDSGQDNLIDYNVVNTGEMNTVYFESGMKREQLILDWDDNDLIVSVAGNSSQLKIQNFKIDQNQWNFVLDNGFTLNKTQIIDYIGKNSLKDYPIVTDDEAILIASQSQVSGNLLGNDHDPGALELSVVNIGVLHGIYGKLNLASNGSYNYIVDPEKVIALKQNQSVTDTFKYTTTNGGFDSNGQLVVNIIGINDVPVASNDGNNILASAHQITDNILSNDHDPENDILSIMNFGEQQGLYGVITFTIDGTYTYVVDQGKVAYLNQNQHVKDIFSYQVTDGGLNTIGELAIDVIGVNDTPEANLDNVYTVANQNNIVGNVLTNDTDPENTVLSVIVPEPIHYGKYGTLQLMDDGNYTYIIDIHKFSVLKEGQITQDAFSYKITDGSLSDIGQLKINLTGVNDAPLLIQDNITLNSDEYDVSGNLLYNDYDPEGSIIEISDSGTKQGTYGVLYLNDDGSYHYIVDNTTDLSALNSEQNVIDIFDYKATDGDLISNSQLIVTINGVHDAPIVVNDFDVVEAKIGEVIGNVLINDLDPENDLLKIIDTTDQQGLYGVLYLTENGDYHYALDKSALLSIPKDSQVKENFNYFVSDGALIREGSLEIEIINLNHVPVAVHDSKDTFADAIQVTGNVLNNDSDLDADSLTVSNSGDQQGHYGALHLNTDGSYHYILDATKTKPLKAGQQVVDSFTYETTDGDLSASSELIINITGVNDVPVAATDVIAVQADAIQLTGNVLNNDSDLDGDRLTVSHAGDQQGRYGALNLNSNGSYHYILDATKTKPLKAGQQVVDSFTYETTDGDLSASSELIINITGVNDAPIALTSIATQNTYQGVDFSMTIPNNLFKDDDQDDNLRYSVTRANGAVLPNWLYFNTTNMSLSGNVPCDINIPLEIKVIATDSQGASSHVSFSIQVGRIITGTILPDCLSGSNYNDIIDGCLGIDTMSGGYGDDIYYVDGINLLLSNLTDKIIEEVDQGYDTVNSTVSYAMDSNVEAINLIGNWSISGTGNDLNNLMKGNSADNTLDGGAGDDYLDGGAGTDKLIGGLGNDILNGGIGNDKLIGGIGNDTYFIDSTSDTITENANEGIDIVHSSVTYSLAGNLENLTLIGANSINGKGNTLANTLKGNNAANMLTGGTGNDTYLFDRTSGIDTIVENDATLGNKDILSFASDITADQLWFVKSGNNLEVSVIGTSNKAIVKDWYLGNAYHVEQLKSGNGLTLLNTEVQNLVQAMAGLTPPPAGQTTLPPEYQTQLHSVISSHWK